MSRGVVAFLQGPPTRFWPELADEFRAVGWRVEKIHLAPAERLFWNGAAATKFSGDIDAWTAFFEDFVARRGVSAVCLYSDGLPHHRAAVRICRRLGVRCFVFENGYLRPDWITCQEGGIYEGQALPRHPLRINEIADASPAPDLDIEFRHRFADEAWREVAFHLCNGLTPRRAWRFDHDRYYHPAVDYASWLKRMAATPIEKRRARSEAMRYIVGERPYYLAPLQMQSDYSIRIASRFSHISEMMEEVIASFAAHAPSRCALLFKVHPHDNGREPWRRHAARIARKLGVERRVRVIDGGPFGALVSSARGVVVINSTSGLHAIREMKPTIALGDAVYDVPGLTHQGGLDRFWRNPDPMDSLLVNDFIRALVARTQLKGSFFQKEGRRAACREAVLRIVGAQAARIEAGAEDPFVDYIASGSEAVA